MKKPGRSAIAAFAMGVALNCSADIPLTYYAPLQGLCGEELKNAVHEVVGEDPNIKMLSYGSGNSHTWWGFYITDRDATDNSVVDRYSNDVRYFGDQGKSVSGMNIEHSFPKSWWGGAENNAYKDLFNLMPCEQSINSAKSNYPMGVVVTTTPKGDNGCTRVGAGEWGNGNWWEPADKWKGDFARGYMYMATAYQNLEFTSSEALKILVNGDYPTLQPKVSDLYIAWAQEDDVTDMETVRNDRVQGIQGNRNPFVDFPNLMEYIWGDSVTTPLDLRFTRKSAPATGVIDGTVGQLETIYANTLLGDGGGFSEIQVQAPATGKSVWQNTSQYGWKGSSFSGSARSAVSDLVSAEIDLTDYAVATLAFDHAMNYASSPSEQMSVLVREASGVDTELDIPVWPKGTSWAFSNSGGVSLDRFSGKKIRIVFRYTSDDVQSATWEIKNLKLTGRKRTSGIDRLPVDIDPDSNKNFPVEYYTIDGRRIDPATFRGIAIRRQGSAVSKVLLK